MLPVCWSPYVSSRSAPERREVEALHACLLLGRAPRLGRGLRLLRLRPLCEGFLCGSP